MVGQTALAFDAPRKVPVRYRILAVLQDGRWHRGTEFVNGDHNFTALAYSQRIGELKREGYRILARHNGGVASYQLIIDSKENQ
jgi:hypothetical protein